MIIKKIEKITFCLNVLINTFTSNQKQNFYRAQNK